MRMTSLLESKGRILLFFYVKISFPYFLFLRLDPEIDLQSFNLFFGRCVCLLPVCVFICANVLAYLHCACVFVCVCVSVCVYAVVCLRMCVYAIV